MKKTFKVVMLPTEKATSIFSYNSDKHILFYEHGRELTTITTHFELYIISDDEIKEGDWIYNPNNGGTIFKATDFEIIKRAELNRISYKDGTSKIVATTDKGLGLPEKYTLDQINLQIPQIPQSFIQAYIKAYNEGYPITEVDLEYQDDWKESTKLYMEAFGDNPNDFKYEAQIKTRPDNTVIVHTSKSYSKDEMFNEVINFAKFYSGMKQESVVKAYNRWLVERDDSITLK